MKVVEMLAIVALAAPIAVHAQGVTYDFTGTVTGANGIYSSVTAGTPITGTYTFNFGAANAAQSSGTVGSAAFSEQSVGGSYYGSPSPSSLVFSTTASFGGFSYSTAAPGTYQSQSSIFGSGFTQFVAQEQQNSSASSFSQSYLELDGSGSVYGSNGLPIFSNAYPGLVQFTTVSSNGTASGVGYTLTSLTAAPVPEPATYALMLGGLGLLGFSRLRRKDALR